MLSMIRYHFILNLRERTVVFWTLAFPILLGCFFYVGIGGVDEASKFDVIPVAVVGREKPEDADASAVAEQTAESGENAEDMNASSGTNYTADAGENAVDTGMVANVDVVFESSKMPGKAEMFGQFLNGISGEVVTPTWDMKNAQAKRALEDGKVSGIFTVDGEKITLTVGKEGIDESILSALLTGFERQTAILADAQENLQSQIEDTMQGQGSADAQEQLPDSAEAAGQAQGTQAALAAQQTYQKLIESAQKQTTEYVKEVSLGGREVASVTSYYFALLAMACLYMCFLGETAAKRTQANISEIGKRISVSPVHRLKIVLANGISAYLVAVINIAIVLFFLIKIVHGIDISMHPGYAVLTTLVGCLIGVTFGILIESIGKWSQNIKSAILIGSSIFCAFLAGLMIGSMKDIIEKHMPVINRLNPAALIADSFYCICVYDDMARLQKNLVEMGLMSLVFLLLAWILTRRVRYDSL